MFDNLVLYYSINLCSSYGADVYSLFHMFLLLCISALIGDSHVMGWGSKAIEIRAVDNGQLDGVFMHKRTLKLIFLCEKNDKVSQTLSGAAKTNAHTCSITRALLLPNARLTTISPIS